MILAVLLTLTVIAAQEGSDRWPEGVFVPGPPRLTEGTAAGSATLTPDEMDAAAIGDYRLEFTVGDDGIPAGGSILIDFPKAWFTNPVPLRKPVQTDDPEAPHYVGVETSNSEVELSFDIEKLSFDSKNERFRHMMHLTVQQAALQPGDSVVVTFADTTAPYIAGNDAVQVAVSTTGGPRHQLIAEGAAYTVEPGEAEQVRLFAPSQGVVGAPISLGFTAFDRFFNVANAFDGEVTLSTVCWSDPQTKKSLPDRVVAFSEDFNGLRHLEWTPGEPGMYFPVVRFNNREFPGGPINVSETPSDGNIYWGDLHSHSGISKDGIGGNDYAYARDVTHLDFFASTEHDISDNGQDSITPSEWAFIQEQVETFYEPGKFVTLLAYEASLGAGHHNVFYRTLDGVPWPGHRLKTIDVLWSKLKTGDAITIPHHLGIRWALWQGPITGPELQPVHTGELRLRGGPQLDWTLPHSQELRPALEIYSKHGTSEYYDPNDALAYEQVRYTSAVSVEGPHYARDAWAAGLPMGVVAASDNHASQPGLPHTGLTAVIAEELTRDAIFDAILNRQTYGTTGERILISEFSIGGVTMGGEGRKTGVADVRLAVAAPRNIALVEILKVEAGGTEWTPVFRKDTFQNTPIVDVYTDVSVNDVPTTFYGRVELEDETNGRVSRAWTSPIWLNRD